MRLESERLLLRQWKQSDTPVFISMCADPDVMRFFPKKLTPEESEKFIEAHAAQLELQGWGYWAAEEKASGNFIGFIALNVPTFEAPFMPCLEVGWRLAKAYWGKGYATEGGKLALDYAFNELLEEEVVAMTSKVNKRSERVMQRLGMTHDPREDFAHPNIPPGHPLRDHVVYRIKKPG